MDLTKIDNLIIWGDNNNYSPAYMLALYAQAVLETGNFTSNIFHGALNAFGMRVPGKRRSLKVGTYDTAGNGTFSAYSSVEDSYKDRIILDEFNRTTKPQTFEEIGEYMREVLRKGYDNNPDYYNAWAGYVQGFYQQTDELKIHKATGFGFVKKTAVGLTGVMIGLGLWLFRKKIPVLKNFFS